MYATFLHNTWFFHRVGRWYRLPQGSERRVDLGVEMLQHPERENSADVSLMDYTDMRGKDSPTLPTTLLL